MASKVLSILF